jgi:hypothetical protein
MTSSEPLENLAAIILLMLFAAGQVNCCLTGSELRRCAHRLCTQKWHSQTADIDDMRRRLERHFEIADFRYQQSRRSGPAQTLANSGSAGN